MIWSNGFALAPDIMARDLATDLGAGKHTLLSQGGGHRPDHRPQPLPLARPERRAPAEPRHARIALRPVDAPGIDNVGPLRQQKARGETLYPGRLLRIGNHRAKHIGGNDPRAAPVDQLEQLIRGALPIRDGNPRDDVAGLGREHRELVGKRAGQRVREGRQKQARLEVLAGERNGSVQRDDGLSGPGRAGYTGGARNAASRRAN
jgi:hypothetical protein